MFVVRVLVVVFSLLLAGCEQGQSTDSSDSGNLGSWRESRSNQSSREAPGAERESDSTERSSDERSSDNSSAGSPSGAKIFELAKNKVGRQSSRNVPGTNNGRLACAWAVNQILEQSIGKTFDHLGTSSMDQELKAGVASGTVQQVDISQAKPGDIIISPTVTRGGSRNVGHVGIVGENGKIYSNSSRNAEWEQNFSMASWKSYYQDNKGLAVKIYRVL